MWTKLALYSKRYPARISGYLSAFILWAHKYLPLGSLDLVIPSVMILIGMGEFSQRVEDRKTIKAIYLEQDINKTDEELIKEL